MSPLLLVCGGTGLHQSLLWPQTSPRVDQPHVFISASSKSLLGTMPWMSVGLEDLLSRFHPSPAVLSGLILPAGLTSALTSPYFPPPLEHDNDPALASLH